MSGTRAGASPSERTALTDPSGAGAARRIALPSPNAAAQAGSPGLEAEHPAFGHGVRPHREAVSNEVLAAPLVFIEKQQGAFRLHALDADALALGLEPGMALADARARVPALVALAHDPEREAACLTRLADLAERYTPMVALDPPDGLILDISGCAHLFGGEGALAADAAALMRHQGLRVRHALASGPEAALALARYGESRGGASVPHDRARPAAPGRSPRPSARPSHPDGRTATAPAPPRRPACASGEAAAIRDLPLFALHAAPDVRHALRRAGFVTLGDLADLPPGPLAARFGAGLIDRLDRLLCRTDSRITPRRLPPPLQVERRFAEPVAHVGSVMAALGALLDAACAILAERGQGGRRFAARLYRSDGAMRDLAVETGQPVRDPAVVLRLFDERVETLADPLDPGFGFDILRLAVPAVEALGAAQGALDGARDPARDLTALLDRLAVRAGPRRLRRLVPRDTHWPERVTRLVPHAMPREPAGRWQASPAGEPPLRPLSLLDPPERIDVMAQVPDGPPRRFRWRGMLHRIVRHEGPERLAPEWWRHPHGHDGAPGLTRDYYRVEDETGHRYWLFRDGLYERETDAPHWYVHGLFA